VIELRKPHPFPPNTAWGMGWPEPWSPRVPSGRGDTPVIPTQRTHGKKSITFNEKNTIF